MNQQKLKAVFQIWADHLGSGQLDDFYAMMSTVYEETVMKNHKDYKSWKHSCPITEKIQPRCMLFKTNYRTIREAKTHIDILNNSLSKY